MTQRDADISGLVGQTSLSSARSFGALEPADGPREQQELLDYSPVPLRNTKMLLVRFRLGARLTPLPYSLDDEDS
jgi:hypothetical protein